VPPIQSMRNCPPVKRCPVTANFDFGLVGIGIGNVFFPYLHAVQVGIGIVIEIGSGIGQPMIAQPLNRSAAGGGEPDRKRASILRGRSIRTNN